MRTVVAVVGAVALLVVGCSGDDEPAPAGSGAPTDASVGVDAEADAAITGEAGADAPVTSEAGADAAETGDAASTSDADDLSACVPYASHLTGGLSDSTRAAVRDCVSGPCLTCALNGGAGPNCGSGGTLTSCILECIEVNEFGTCEAGTCQAGKTCDNAANLCRSDAVLAVNDAIATAQLDLQCVGCYSGSAVCMAENCLLDCMDDGCPCDLCRCTNGCSDVFITCAGVPYEVDCASVPAVCE